MTLRLTGSRSLIGCSLIIFAAAGCQSGQTTAPAQSAAAATADAPKAILHVKGMSCPLCAHAIDVQLRRLPGVTQVKIDLGSGQVTASLAQGARPTDDQFAQAIRDSGFTLDRIVPPTGPAVFEALCSGCQCKDNCQCKPGQHNCIAACACHS